MKNKTATGSNTSAQGGSEVGERSPEMTDQADSKSMDSTKSAEEEDDEVLFHKRYFWHVYSDVLLFNLLLLRATNKPVINLPFTI